MSKLLEIKNLSFTYPQLTVPALQNISCEISSGEMVLLCGQSGSGKTTLLKHMKKNLLPFGTCEGEIIFDGEDLENIADQSSATRIGYVAQNPENQLVTDTVWHELAFGLENLGTPVGEIRRRTAEIAEYFGMSGIFRKKVDELSGGQKQMLNLAAVMIMKPELLILDEPTAQMDPLGAWRFFQMLKRINQDFGTTIVLCEQRLEEIMPLVDRVLMMHEGELVVDCALREIATAMESAEQKLGGALPVREGLPVALRSYLYMKEKEGVLPISVGEGKNWLKGKKVTGEVSYEKIPKRECVARLSEVEYGYQKRENVLKGMDLEIEKGAIYALVGGNGSGKTTALKVLAGIYKAHHGKVRADGVVRYLAQNPLSVFTEISVEDELFVMAHHDEHRQKAVDEMLSLMELEKERKQNPLDLSGGQQQRLALGKMLLTNPDIILLDEPTKGLDAAFKNKLVAILKALQDKGVTIVMVSHDLEFCAMNATHCGLMFDGTVMGSADVRTFFAKNSFYTTATARMTQGIIDGCITFEDVKQVLKER